MPYLYIHYYIYDADFLFGQNNTSKQIGARPLNKHTRTAT